MLRCSKVQQNRTDKNCHRSTQVIITIAEQEKEVLTGNTPRTHDEAKCILSERAMRNPTAFKGFLLERKGRRGACEAPLRH
jgi:hypothetical protein